MHASSDPFGLGALGLGALFGNPVPHAQRSIEYPPMQAPLIGYAQRFEWDNGCMVLAEGFATADGALWRAARMLYHSVTPRKMRRVMSKDQRARLIEVARRKLGN